MTVLVSVVCVRLVLVARLAGCVLGILCDLGRALSVIGGSLVPFISVFAWFSPKKLDTFFLINRLGAMLIASVSKKKYTIKYNV
jgi:hypothetical protein